MILQYYRACKRDVLDSENEYLKLLKVIEITKDTTF